jgi:hypothetical protein
VPKRQFKLPRHLIKKWPEALEGLEMNTMPLAYLDLIKLEFTDGRIWHISINDLLKEHAADDVVDHLLNIIEGNEGEIKKIDFDIDINRLKSDISSQTKKLF